MKNLQVLKFEIECVVLEIYILYIQKFILYFQQFNNALNKIYFLSSLKKRQFYKEGFQVAEYFLSN